MEVLGAYSDLSSHIGQHLAVAGRRGREYDSFPEVLVGTPNVTYTDTVGAPVIGVTSPPSPAAQT